MFDHLRFMLRSSLLYVLWIFSYPLEIATFTLGLVIVAFSEIGRIVVAPTRFVIRDFSVEKLGRDLHRSKILLKQSRLVETCTGKVPGFIPALFMTSLLVGIPTVAVAAKAAWLLHLTPFDGVTRSIPLLTPYIGTASAALHTIFCTAIAAKLAKLPALIVATCCPQFEDSWIHRNINSHLIHFFKWIGKWALGFTLQRLRWAKESMSELGARLLRLEAVAAVASGASTLASLCPDALALASRWRAAPARGAVAAPRVPEPESEWKLKARTIVHTVLAYGLTASLPFLTYWALMAGYDTGKAATARLLFLAGMHGDPEMAIYVHITVGLIFGFATGTFVALGGLYGVASLGYKLFVQAARGACVLSERAEVAIAQSMHEALLLSLVPAFAMVEGMISVPVAVAVAATTTAAVAWFGGWRAIYLKYRRINEQKLRARGAVARPVKEKVGLDGFFVIP